MGEVLAAEVPGAPREGAAADELLRSEQRFRLLVEAVEDYAIFMLDPDGLVASWNAGAQRSKGWTAEEVIGRHFRIFYPPEVAERGHPEHELAVALRDGHYEEEGWRLRKDGSRFWATVLITAVHDPAGRHVGFAKVTRDTSERRRLELEREAALEALQEANAELAVLNERLQQAADDQAQFLAVTAHELRTPVALLNGSAELLAEHGAALSEEERQETFRAMRSGAARLRRLVDDLLTASRLQSSALVMRHDVVPVSSFVLAAVDTVRRTHPAADLRVGELPGAVVRGDPDRLAQALENLLTNALRHGRPPVEVSARHDGDRVLVQVADHGAGVAPRIRPRLFERFATGLTSGGTGLGLFIVRELARAHGGEARYLEPGPGRPGAFVVDLPARPTDADDPPPSGPA